MTPIQIVLIVLIVIVVAFRVKKIIDSRNLQNFTSLEAVDKLKTDKNVVLLDVRASFERERGSIKGSIHIPLNEINASNSTLTKLKGKEIICYCQSGSRSVSAALKLQKLGFNAGNMLGGYGSFHG